ncbi:MAG: T9SS type A sorting domain-containing protein [Saprospiraceae bacterium]|nr:T9SS type A sorting domain-containing protein [Saprospiraceae bacterium]
MKHHNNILKFLPALFAFILFFNTLITASNVSDSCDAIACGHPIHLTVGKNSSYPATPKLFLESPICNDRDYYIYYRDTNNVRHTLDTIDAQLPSVFIFEVEDGKTGNSCWGEVRLAIKDCDGNEDPILETKNFYVSCTDDISPEDLGFPLPDSVVIISYGNRNYQLYNWTRCDSFALLYGDATVHYDCLDPYTAIVARCWLLIDGDYNEYRGCDSIFITNGPLDQLEPLPDYNGIDKPILNCSDNIFMNGTTIPDPQITGQPITHNSCSDISSNFHDQVFTLADEPCYSLKRIVRKWTVLDWCSGNEETITQEIHVECSSDTIDPVVVCQNRVVVTLDNTGHYELTPDDIDEGSYDNCGIARYSFDESGQLDVIRFDTSDANSVITVKLFVTDHAGNQNECWTLVEVRSNINITGNLGGRYFNYKLEPLNFNLPLQYEVYDRNLEKQVALECKLPANPDDLSFNLCVDDSNYVAPFTLHLEHFDNNPRDGLSTLDYILLIKMLINPDQHTVFHQIAADINNSESITVSDAAELRAIILGAKNLERDPWEFYVADTTQILPIQAVDIDQLPYYDADIVPVKIGELSDRDLTGRLDGKNQTRSPQNVTMYLHDKALKAGEIYDSWIHIDKPVTAIGLQFSQKFNKADLEIVEVGAPDLVSGENWAGYEDEWRYVYVEPALDETRLEGAWLKVTYKAKSSGMLSEFLSGDDLPLDLLLIDSDLSEVKINLEVRQVTSTDDGTSSELVTVSPNPFTEQVKITIGNISTRQARFEIYTLNGQLIYTKSVNEQESIEIGREILKCSSLYVGRLITEEEQYIVKMHRIER